MKTFPNKDIVICCHFNVQIHKEEYLRLVAGKHTLHGRINNNG